MMIDFKDISIITHVRIDCPERLDNFKIREEYFNKYCTNLEFVYVEDDSQQRLPKNLYDSHRYTFYQNDGPHRKSIGHNMGVSLTKRPMLCFLDLDCIVNPTNILRGVSYAKEGFHVVSPFNGTAFYTSYLGKKSFAETPTNNTFQNILPIDQNRGVVTPMGEVKDNTAPGGCHLMTTSTFYQTGGYNPNFVGWGWEDNEFLTRFKKLGGMVGVIKDDTATLIHLNHDNITGTPRDNQVLLGGYNKLIYSAVRGMSDTDLKSYIKSWKL